MEAEGHWSLRSVAWATAPGAPVSLLLGEQGTSHLDLLLQVATLFFMPLCLISLSLRWLALCMPGRSCSCPALPCEGRCAVADITASPGWGMA